MGNNSSHKRTKLPKEPHKERLPEMNKALQKMQFFSHLKRKKPRTKDVLLLPLDKGQHPPEAAAGSGARPEGRGEDAGAPPLQGAGDGAGRREGARAREMKILVLLVLPDARLQEEGRCAGGGPKGARG